MRRNLRITRVGVLGGVAAALLAGTAYATIPGSDGVIDGCYAKSGGSLRVIDGATTNCKSGEGALSWNQQGVPGPKGDTGVPGLAGPQGEPGPAGPGARWAEITTSGPDATIVAQSGGFSIASEASGTFTLDTGASMQGKTVLATLRPGTSGNGATVQAERSGATKVSVETYNSVGSVVSEDFTVAVL